MDSVQFDEICELVQRRTDDVANFFGIECTPCVQRVNKMSRIEHLRVENQIDSMK